MFHSSAAPRDDYHHGKRGNYLISMKKAKFLTIAALLGCCSVLAACGGEESSVEEPIEEATVSYVSENPNMLFAFVRLTNPGDLEDDRICGSNGDSYIVDSGSVAIGTYVYIENLDAAADYTVAFASGSTLSGSLEAWGEGESDPIQITGDCTITISAASEEDDEDDGTSQATITYVSTNPNMLFAFVSYYQSDLDDPRICGSNGDTYIVSSGSVEVGSYVYIENLGAAADYVLQFEDTSTVEGSLEAWGGESDAIQINGNCTLTLSTAQEAAE